MRGVGRPFRRLIDVGIRSAALAVGRPVRTFAFARACPPQDPRPGRQRHRLRRPVRRGHAGASPVRSAAALAAAAVAVRPASSLPPRAAAPAVGRARPRQMASRTAAAVRLPDQRRRPRARPVAEHDGVDARAVGAGRAACRQLPRMQSAHPRHASRLRDVSDGARVQLRPVFDVRALVVAIARSGARLRRPPASGPAAFPFDALAPSAARLVGRCRHRRGDSHAQQDRLRQLPQPDPRALVPLRQLRVGLRPGALAIVFAPS